VEQITAEESLVTEGGLTVRYRGANVDAGRMTLEDFIPAVRGLEAVLERAAYLTAEDEIRATVYITATFRQSSFEFHVILEQVLPPVGLFVMSGGLQSASEAIGKAFSAAGSLIELVKTLGRAKSGEVQTTTLSDGSVQYNISIKGQNNKVMIVPQPVARMERDPVMRRSLEPIIAPVLDDGIDEVDFLPDGDISPSVVGKKDAPYFLKALDQPEIDESFQIEERILTVVKPSFAEHRRWRLLDGDHEFGATMDDLEFQRRVTRREMLFGHGDQLRVKLATRLHRAAKPEYRVQKVLEIIRPEEPPIQLRLA
jgi:hypothetical protein